ncbi:cobaltochelatase subunit CobN [Thermoleptolyngbya sichuanensis A183]|uniref:Cobaltochelatase subunit CobN n=1 Tax=Thermoleptolyngbya sichuanensis A183 TaxID=2737172 RepID=A0A6M8B570_9CYAN|nr:cobaltochelatase subunit CobN [Thermoleptolyngbya sichuanensis]QKD82439.1 cobaltochelatase subunit CobN [Thermoleptolyngbya sichuanensis A183]
MHRLAASPGGWNPDTEGVIFLEQTPAPIVFLTAADTDIQSLAHALPHLPAGVPALRVASLLQLQQQLSIDTYAEEVLSQAQVIILRLLGGRAYWPYGLEVLKQTAAQTGATLFVLPGDDRPDPDLLSHSTAPLAAVHRLWRYLTEGGRENWVNALLFLADECFGQSFSPPPPQPVPKIGVYAASGICKPPRQASNPQPAPNVALLFYRAHYLAGNTQPIEALCELLAARGMQPIPVFVSSLRDPDVQAELLTLLQPKDEEAVQVVLNTTSFSLARLEDDAPDVSLWTRLDAPVLQVILSGGTREQWQAQSRGLSPRDVAMNVALPEVDGRIISRAVSFKTVQTRHDGLETDVVEYAAVGDRLQFVADLAAAWVRLRQTPPAERRIALILANYPTRNGRLANGVGLDTPASTVEILKALKQAGYTLSDIPATGDDLIHRLTAGPTNDPEAQHRPIAQSLSLSDYWAYFQTLPPTVQTQLGDRWGDGWCQESQDGVPIPGIQLGNVFIGIQPSRGYDLDPSLNYHAPDLEPTHAYLAFYHWVRSHFGAHAVVHVGKHGNLEWLPGKSVALSATCYPEIALGPLPHLYPFIVNDPGEGSQAKRRAQAVIIDHLTPPLTRAELYGPLQQLEALVDEYYEAQSLDPSRLPVIRDRLLALFQQTQVLQDLGLTADSADSREIEALLPNLDTYLCELKEAQIRDGLHILGQCPSGRQLRDLVVAIARHPTPGYVGLTRAIAVRWHLDLDPLTADPAQPLTPDQIHRTLTAPKLAANPATLRNAADLIDLIEQEAAAQVERAIGDLGDQVGNQIGEQHPGHPVTEHTDHEARHPLPPDLLPALRATPQELIHLLRGLDGCYVPSGASGAPTRGRPEVLPTGRNFYSVDIRAIPTESAWDVGRRAAEALVERYTQEHGDYPQTLGLSMWGTATMRTGGDDLAEALALLGVRPVWDGASRRVVDFEILPVSLLGRPRVDVTLRISGFFRDAFPNLIDLFHQAVTAVSQLDEPPADNPLAARVRQEATQWQAAGLTPEQAEGRSRYRIFGSKPGAYGAGLQGLIDAQNWTTDADLARAYINWSSYAYTGQGEGRAAPEALESRLKSLQIVLHNQDNREHDLLDSDDYYQFQGGMTVATRALTGQTPQIYFGDHALPEAPKIRTLQEEIARVYRSRVINPKWIEGVMRHGYKGAFEMAATVDYLFAYDATTRCVADYMYEGVAQAYVLDETVQAFVQDKNPWALRDMAERLLEAHQRGLWAQAPGDVLNRLRAIALQAEAHIESRL